MKQRILILALAVLALAASLTAQIVDPNLQARLLTANPTTPLRVVATFDHPPTALDGALLASVASRSQLLVSLPMALLEITPAGIQQLMGTPGLESLYLDERLEYYLHESVPLIQAPRAWQELGVRGKGIGVAVIDTGIDATHPDLPFGSKVVQNVKIVGLSAEDSPTGSGIVQVTENLPDTDLSSGHGTHVAGTVAGLGNASKTNSADDIGGYGYHTGVAPEAHLVGIGAGDVLFIFYALEGFDYAISRRNDYNIKVISNSWGSTMRAGEAFDPNNPINKASKIAHDAGMTVVFAAGNSGPGTDTLNRYSVAPWVIGVAAGNKDGQTLADFSSRGRYEDDFFHPTITAPGVGIVAARATTGDGIPEENFAPYYTSLSGTSMATPHVSGVVALLYEVRSDMTPDLAKRIIANTATPMPDYKEYASGAGYINAYAAVAQAKAIKNVRAYRDPKTGKTIDVYVTEEQITGTIGPAVASYNRVLATNRHPFGVSTGAVFLDAKLTWESFANDIDLFLQREDTSTTPSTWVAEGASQDFQALTLQAREGVAIDYPIAGNWRCEVRGWLNAPTAYTFTVQQYFPLK